MKAGKFFSQIFECESKVFIIIFSFYALGIVFGSVSACNLEYNNIHTLNCDVFELFFSDSFIQLFLKNLIIISLAFFLGYSVIGMPFICFVVLYDGICCGIFCTTFSVFWGLKGVLCSALCFYIYFFLKLICVICLSFSSLRLSLALLSVFKSDTRYISPREYSIPHIIKYTVFIVITLFDVLYYFYIAQFLLNKLL